MGTGIVKWLDAEKGYGCIRLESGEEVIVPVSALQASGLGKVRSGEAVQFDIIAISADEILTGEAKTPAKFKKFSIGDSLRLTPSALSDLSVPALPAKTLAKEEPPLRDLEVRAIRRRFGIPDDLVGSVRLKLGIRRSLHLESDLVKLVENQLSLSAIQALLQNGILEKEIYSIIVPRRILQHRRARKEKLSREESDRAVRLARLVALTEKIFGDAQEGMHWLRSPKKRFHGRTPMAMMETEVGSRLVEEALYQIDEGMAA